KIKNTLIDLAIDWKSNTFDSMKIKLEDALKAGEPKNSGHDYKKDVKKRLRKDFRNPIKILPGLDEYIDGGISGGELFVVLAPTGGGKSMFLVRNGVEALNHGKNVLYFTLELSEELVGRRFDACLNAVPIRKVHDFEDLISETADSLKANIKIKHYPDGTATINTFYAHVDWLKANENFIPELIIVDYADNMKALSKGEALRHELVDIYRALRAMAIELGVPVLTASQTSGDGYSKKELELGMTAEAKSKNNIADVVVGFGRDGDQVRANEATLKILKNRNGPIGFTVPLVFDSNLLIIGAKDQKDLSHEEKQVFSGIGMVGNKNSKDTKSINKYVSNNKETSNILAILQNQQYTPEVND
ncbi:MAG: DnaB-like helicase C-terminal domain-containing protein, partial [Candidatus Izemoplasmatales bacterium]